jgi:hypothetical protein
MSQPSRAPSGYSWTGSLKNTNIRQLYERCQRLRLTGKMQLRQGDQALELVWIGGEPIETEADQGTRSLPLWNSGDFQVDQCIPDWKGALTKHVELTGALRAGQIQAIYKLCSDNQLSADVELKRQSGEAAQVRFTLGKAEGATISGQAESALTALSKLSAWSDGTFRVGLRPLFGDVQAAEAPVFSEKDRSDDQFDVTGSLDIARGNIDWPPKLREPSGSVGQPVPMGGPSARSLPGAVGGAGAANPAPSASSGAPAAGAAVPAPASTKSNSSGVKIPPHLTATLINTGPNPAPPASIGPSAPTVPMSTMSRENAMKLAQAESQALQAAAPTAQPAAKPGRTLVVVSIIVIVLCALAVGGLLVWKQLLGGGMGATTSPAPASAPAPAPAAPK